MGKKVSVIVPVYRVQQWLERCVGSITGQTWDDLEVILVDDGSPDECPRLCDEWAKRDGRIRVLHKKNGGLMAAWMDGVRQSSGDYLCFVDSDDWIDACMVEKMLERTTGCTREIICGNYIQEEQSRSFAVVQALPPGIYEGRALREQVFKRLLGEERRPVTMSRCMKLFSRELIEENMHYCDPSVVMGEDVNITLPAILSAERIVIMEGACWYHYLYLNNSMAHRYNEKLYDNIVRLWEIIRRVLKEKGVSNWEEQADREFLLLLFLVIKNEVRGGQKGWQKRLYAICSSDQVRSILRRMPLDPKEKENKLLYLAMRHPGPGILAGLKLAFSVYDLRKR